MFCIITKTTPKLGYEGAATLGFGAGKICGFPKSGGSGKRGFRSLLAVNYLSTLRCVTVRQVVVVFYISGYRKNWCH